MSGPCCPRSIEINSAAAGVIEIRSIIIRKIGAEAPSKHKLVLEKPKFILVIRNEHVFGLAVMLEHHFVIFPSKA